MTLGPDVLNPCQMIGGMVIRRTHLRRIVVENDKWARYLLRRVHLFGSQNDNKVYYKAC